ncbi:cytochrome c-type biogenesis CcmF C-terminal domain-containing protein [Escherichia coli]
MTGPNWRGGVAIIGVTRDGKPETVLYAEKRYYNTAWSMMTEAAIDGGSRVTCTPRSVKSWKTARGPCVFTTNHLFAGFGRAG